MSRSSPRLGRRPAGTPRACPMAPPLSGRTCALEAVREDRACTDRVSLSRGCLGCGLGRNIVVSASVGHRPTSCADCHHGCERSIALRAGHTRPTARSTLRPFSNSYSVFSLWLGPGDPPARENASASQSSGGRLNPNPWAAARRKGRSAASAFFHQNSAHKARCALSTSKLARPPRSAPF